MSATLQLEHRVLERARLSRDPRFDGRFFVAVTSTGIYCRPVCPAPTPKSAHVRYFASAAAAAEAGFRPCLRCRPEAAPGTPAWLGTSAVVRRALRLIQQGALDETGVEQFAARIGVGARHLHRLFVQHVGASPSALAQTRRLQFAKRLLDETSLPITQIALAAGFGSLRRFNDAFQQTYERAPRELRGRGHAGGARRAASSTGAGAADQVVLRLAYRPPYDWQHLAAFLAARAIAGVERVDQRGYARTLMLPSGAAIIGVRPVAHANELELSVRGARASALFELTQSARRVFDLSADPGLTARALRADPLLAAPVRRRPGLRIPGIWDPFECVVRAVMGQQISVAAARTFAARLVRRAGQPLARPEDGLTHVFPAPAAVLAADLTDLGLTCARTATLIAAARAFVDGTLDWNAPPDELVAALQNVPGIGAWTAQYIALRALGEPDAFPAADIVLRRMAAAGRRPLSARALERRADGWRPWRSYAVMHLWCAASEAAI